MYNYHTIFFAWHIFNCIVYFICILGIIFTENKLNNIQQPEAVQEIISVNY